jgi:hypothetical protein
MSYSGTVHCGHCYEKGHNKSACPKMRREAAANPDSWEAKTVARYEARRSQPKICSYCDGSGHTRAGCHDMKQHKVAFTTDLILWRQAVVKWIQDTGLGIGALVRCKDASYHRGDSYMHPNDENYIPPVGLIMSSPPQGLTHYNGIMNTNDWSSGQTMFSFTRIGATAEEQAYRTTVGITLPNIPGIVPRFGKAYYGDEKMDRSDRINNVNWEVVSPGQTTDFTNDNFLCPKQWKKTAKTHFAAPQGQTRRHFYTFDFFQRTQLLQYVNGEIELSEMKDPEVPGTHT